MTFTAILPLATTAQNPKAITRENRTQGMNEGIHSWYLSSLATINAVSPKTCDREPSLPQRREKSSQHSKAAK